MHQDPHREESYHIRPLREEFHHGWGDTRVGFKVQLAVEFYIYPLYLGQGQIQEKKSQKRNHQNT